MTIRQPAIILLGPTGSGKTPLGELLEERGHHGARCVHFDFGARLRDVVTRAEPDAVVSAADIEFLRGVLETGALLEDRDFPIAQRVLLSFLQRSDAQAQSRVVMNGLPRHVSQAESLAALLEVCRVILLKCPPETVLERIARDSGGDRSNRTDDEEVMIQRKLEIFFRRTIPLVEFYRDHNAEIVEVYVTASMTAEEMWRRI